MSRLESALAYAKNRLASAETLADELFFHWIGYSSDSAVIQAVKAGIPLFGLRDRGTISKAYILHESGYHLLIRIPKNEQAEFIGNAWNSGFEKEVCEHYWGYSFKKPVPSKYLPQAIEWYQRMKREREYYRDFPETVKPNELRYLPEKYIVGLANIYPNRKYYNGIFVGGETTLVQRYYGLRDTPITFVGKIDFVPKIPNKGISKGQIAGAFTVYKRSGRNDNRL